MGKLMERFREAQGQHPCEGRAPVSCSGRISSSIARPATAVSPERAQLFSLFGLVNLVLARKR